MKLINLLFKGKRWVLMKVIWNYLVMLEWGLIISAGILLSIILYITSGDTPISFWNEFSGTQFGELLVSMFLIAFFLVLLWIPIKLFKF